MNEPLETLLLPLKPSGGDFEPPSRGVLEFVEQAKDPQTQERTVLGVPVFLFLGCVAAARRIFKIEFVLVHQVAKGGSEREGPASWATVECLLDFQYV